MTTLPLETCKLAKDAGFPQVGRSHLIWMFGRASHRFDFDDLTHHSLIPVFDGEEVDWGEWCAAPDPLTLLDWLEAEKGVQWRHDYWKCYEVVEVMSQGKTKRVPGDTYEIKPVWSAVRDDWKDKDGRSDPITADTAADLCLAILRRLTEGT